MVKKLPLILLLILTTVELYSQIDNQFWFVAPDISATHGDDPIFIRLSSMNDPVDFTLTMPADLSFVPISGSIGPNSTYSIPLTTFKSQIENSPPDQVNNKGLLLTTNNLVTAYYEEANNANPSIFSLKGRNALGNEFYIVSQNNYQNQTYSDDFETFEIVATEDNTTVTITTTDELINHPANSTFVVTLNKGQTYSARATQQGPTRTLAGSHIVSDKPIAVTWADDSIVTGGWDVVGDQIIPVTVIGQEYIAIKGYANNSAGDNEEHVYIVGTSSNTGLTIDGTFIQNINAGELYNYPIPTASATAFIQTTAPAYVMHLSGFPGECGASLLPQIFCTGSRQIGFYRTGSGSFSLMILTLAGNEGSFLMDGSPTVIQASDFLPVPGTSGVWVYCRKAMSTGLLPLGSHLLTNSTGKFHLGIINMLGGSAEYGYFSYFSSINLGVDQTICEGTSTTLNGGEDWTTYLWEVDIAGTWTPVGGNSQFLVVTNPGHYRCSVTGQNCALQDDVYVFNYPVLEPVITGVNSFCGLTTNVTYSATANFSPYTWSVSGGTITSGQGTQTITVDWTSFGDQTITLNCINSYGCPVQKTFPVTVHPAPSVTLDQPASACIDATPFALTGGDPAGGVYSGPGVNSGTGFFDPSIGVGGHLITYTYTDAFGCINSDTKTLTVNPLPIVTYATQPAICISSPPILLSGGTPSGGQYSGTGVNTIAGTFDPALAPAGAMITYTYLDANFCSSYAQQFQQIIPLPTTQGTITGINSVCQGDQGSSFTLLNPDPLATSFTWNLSPASAGIVTGTAPTCTVDWSGTYSGTAQLIFIASSNCGSSGPSTGYNIVVKPMPTVTISECNDLKTTKNAKPILLKGGRPIGAAGVYEGTGITENSPGSGMFVFNPADNLIVPSTTGAPYTITYRYTNAQGCSATATEQILVYPSNANQPCQAAQLTDVRDGQTYATFIVGSGASARCWMAKNLNYGTSVAGSTIQTDNCMVEKYCAGDIPALCNQSGGYYQWRELMLYGGAEGDQGLCPPGWHVATKAEWDQLLSDNQGVGQAGSFLKDQATSAGFHGLTSGIFYLNQTWSFTSGITTGSMFWTSHGMSATTALANGLNSFNPSVSTCNGNIANAFSVRCVKD